MTTTLHHPPASPPTAPPEVRRAIGALYVVAAIHGLALALVLTHRDTLTAAIAAAHPAWSPDRVDKVAGSQFLSTLARTSCCRSCS